MLRIAHVINPVAAPKSSDLAIALPVTLESLRVALAFPAENVSAKVFAAFYPEDEKVVPDWCTKLRPLDRSVLDLNQFKIPRKLPLIRDILDRVVEVSDADYLLYTNIDIAVMPHFYSALAMLLEGQFDALSVTRRTISRKHTSPEELAFMYAEMGEQHPGNDCFLFPRNIYPQFDLGQTCIGAKYFAKMLLLNIIVHSKSFHVFRRLHLTFHLGDDKIWQDDRFDDYRKHQKRQLKTALRKLGEAGKLKGGDPFIEKWTARHGLNE